MNNQNGVLTAYDFKGNYTFKDNTATMISTHFKIPAMGNIWETWAGKWTATLTEDNRVYVEYNGGANSRNLLQENISNIYGYRNIK